jgi:nucleotide-binding universal stress UspA family protein
MFNRILVPTDFSPPSQAALEHGRMLAEHFNASLQLLHVVEEPATSSGFVADGFAPTTDTMREGQLVQARDALARLISVTDRTRLRVRPRRSSACRRPRSWATPAPPAPVIVMGTHGRTGLAHLLLGSVAEQVVRSASCAVLTVRHVPAAQEITMALATCSAPLSAQGRLAGSTPALARV